MTLLGAAVVVGLFALVVERTRLPGLASEATSRCRASLAVVRDDSLSDREKEEALRRAAPALLGLVFRLGLSGLAALGLPLAALWLGDRAGWVSLPDVLGFLMRVDVILVLTAIGIWAGWRTARRAPRSSRRHPGSRPR